jgi:hypothetical protein
MLAPDAEGASLATPASVSSRTRGIETQILNELRRALGFKLVRGCSRASQATHPPRQGLLLTTPQSGIYLLVVSGATHLSDEASVAN